MMDIENLRQETINRISEFFNGESNNPKVDTYKKLLDFENAIKKEINKNIEMAYDHGYYDGRVLQIERKDILHDRLQSKKSLL